VNFLQRTYDLASSEDVLMCVVVRILGFVRLE